jgi:hypothetical protein
MPAFHGGSTAQLERSGWAVLILCAYEFDGDIEKFQRPTPKRAK